jgi:hypothetical protein
LLSKNKKPPSGHEEGVKTCLIMRQNASTQGEIPSFMMMGMIVGCDVVLTAVVHNGGEFNIAVYGRQQACII